MNFYCICCHTRGHPKPARNPRVRVRVQKCTRGSTCRRVFPNSAGLTAGRFLPNPHPHPRVPSLVLGHHASAHACRPCPLPAARAHHAPSSIAVVVVVLLAPVQSRPCARARKPLNQAEVASHARIGQVQKRGRGVSERALNVTTTRCFL